MISVVNPSCWLSLGRCGSAEGASTHGRLSCCDSDHDMDPGHGGGSQLLEPLGATAAYFGFSILEHEVFLSMN